MSTVELNKIKMNLIAWIHQATDVKLLSFLEGLKNSSSKKNWWDDLSTAQQKIVMQGLADAGKGKVVSSEKFWKELKNA